jgi:outer membrane receptor protein involved in Fe transport
MMQITFICARHWTAVSLGVLQLGVAETLKAGEPPADPLRLEEIVVTGNAGQVSKLRSSVAVSTLDPEQVQQSVPGNAADILRNVPGVLAQASGGEGNANISARGLPQSGGAKLVQFQEDGLPVLDFGDIEFGTADTFVRMDFNVARVEVIRGGSAATFASNAPGGVVNFISKTGDVASGNIGLTRGLDYERTRLDIDYGQPFNDGWRFHVGGHYRRGEGPRRTGYDSESGGQIKGNMTREFAAGYLRFNFKVLDDRAPVYLPVPLSITGTNSNPRVNSLAGFDVRDGAMQSRYFQRDLSVRRNGGRSITDISDGYRSKSRAIGGDMAFDLADAWRVEDRFRVAATSGGFVGPYPAQVNAASALADQIGGPGASLRYATGPLAGQSIADPASLNGNGLAVRTHLFNTTLENFDNAANDLRVTKAFGAGGSGATRLSLGYFKSRQNIVMDWHWNTYLQEVRGENAALLDVIDTNGNRTTQDGLIAYGQPYWGNCCVRYYDLRYDTDAPYMAAHWQSGPFDLDASLRHDIASASGSYAGAIGTTPLDANGDGLLQVPEQTTPVVNSNLSSPVDYTHRYLSYSLGGNYLLTQDLALFTRVSEGGRANATRLLFGGGIRPDGSVAEPVAVNEVRQYEGGAKWRGERFSWFGTLFYARTKVTDQNITSVTTRFTDRTFDAKGVELEGEYRLGRFGVNGGLTLTDARIARDEITPGNDGQRINPRAIYQLTATYHAEKLDAGLNAIGATASPLGRGLDMPAFVQVNAFVSYELTEGFRFAIRGNNLGNTIGLTEVPDGSAGITSNGLLTGRSISGRTIEATLTYSLAPARD